MQKKKKHMGAKERKELPEGFQVKASLNLWPSISMSRRIGTKFSAVGLSHIIAHHHHHHPSPKTPNTSKEKFELYLHPEPDGSFIGS
jgi:hypothetical protein